MDSKIKILIGMLVIGLILTGGWWIWSSQVSPEPETQLEPIEKFARQFFIKSVTVYKDHIVVQVDKDQAMSESPYFWGNMFLEPKEISYTESYQRRRSEFKQTGRAELQIGEGLVIALEDFGWSAHLKAIKGEVAFIEVGFDSGWPHCRKEPCSWEYIVKIDKIYKRPGKHVEEKVTITTNKTEYKRGEAVKITIKNNTTQPISICYPYYSIERFSKGNWIKVPIDICACPEVYCEIEPCSSFQVGETFKISWFQREVKCPELIQVVPGKYRAIYPGEGRKISYSTEFTIK